MSKQRIAAAALAVVALLMNPVIGSVASAQGGETDDARAAFYKGRALYKAGEYAKAVEMLQKAYTLKPHPALQRYIGLTYYKMNKPHEAITAFRRYLKEASNAPDRDEILAKVRELEMVVGASDDEEKTPALAAPTPTPPTLTPAPPPQPAPPVAGPAPPSLVPTGEDDEVPGEAARPSGMRGERDKESSMLSVLKWVALGVGAAGLATGAVFSGLAAGKASDLEQAVVDSGNPTKDSPKVAYAREHHDLQEAFKRNRAAAIISFVAGGVASAAAVTLFLLDMGRSKERRRSGVQVAPVVGSLYGLSGQVRF